MQPKENEKDKNINYSSNKNDTNKIKNSNFKTSLINLNNKKKRESFEENSISELSSEESGKSTVKNFDLKNNEYNKNKNSDIKENYLNKPINYDINVLTNLDKYKFHYRSRENTNNLHLNLLSYESQTPSHSLETPKKKNKMNKKRYDFII